MNNNNLKVNLHICEGCNYKCRHCFAKFNCRKTLSLSDWKKIVDNVLSNDSVNAINIAGGEPMLYPQLHELTMYIKSKGIKLSLITNGSLMTADWIRKNAALYETIGFSIDSLDPALQKEAGRVDCRGNVVSPDEFALKIQLLRRYNPDIRIKVNTVVTRINKNDCIAQYIKDWRVDRWKILKMQYFEDDKHCNGDIMIDDTDYIRYAQKAIGDAEASSNRVGSKLYFCGDTEVVIEGNISGSYIMVDANGYLVDDRETSNYRKISNCLEEKFSIGLIKLDLDTELYNSRYENPEYEAEAEL